MKCVNCGTETMGRFCSHCGQSSQVKRITFKEGWYDFWARIYGFDGMFPRTFKDLTIRPGFAAREFINGNRARYYGPVGYFFLMITLFLLLLSMIDMDFLEYMKAMRKSMPIEQKGTEVEKGVESFVANNVKLVAFVFIPFQAFVARKIFFRMSGLNFMEHCILPLYVMGHWYWITIVVAIYYKLTGQMLNAGVELLLAALFMGFAYTSFGTNQTKVRTFLKGVGIYATSYVLFLLTVTVLAIVAILILAVMDPELLKSFKSPTTT